MAQIQETRLIDDLDGSEAAETINFSVDGKSYEIELSAANATALRDVFTPYVAAARKVTKLNRDVTAALSKAAARRAMAGERPARADRGSLVERAQQNQAIREWALAHGFQVAERGRIPQQVIDAYEDEHGTAA